MGPAVPASLWSVSRLLCTCCFPNWLVPLNDGWEGFHRQPTCGAAWLVIQHFYVKDGTVSLPGYDSCVWQLLQALHGRVSVYKRLYDGFVLGSTLPWCLRHL